VQPLIVVPANDIDAAGFELSIELPVAWLDAKLEEARATEPGRLEGRLSRSGKADIVVRCRLAAQLTVPCARCLEPAPVDIRTDLSLLLKPKTPSAAGSAGHSNSKPARGASAPRAQAIRNAEYEFAAAEADLDEYDGERVVLDDFVREALLLELPSFPLCSESCGRSADEPENGKKEGQPDEAGPGRPSPFEALRHLIPGSPLPSGEPFGNARSPSPADLRRISRAKNKAKPKIRSSALHRGKK
jgi:uncharacterized protein